MAKSSTVKLKRQNKDIGAGEFIRFPKKIPFTQKERIVFYGLVKFPELNDQKLSKKLKIKRSTVTAIRNKLKRRNFYFPRVIPNFKLLECELMTFIWGKLSYPAPLEEKRKMPVIKNAMQSPEAVFQIITDDEFFSLLIFKNFTEFKKMEDKFAHVYKKYSSKERNVNIVHFPLETSEIFSLFDYSLCLKDLLKLKHEDKKTATKPKTSKAVPSIELKEREKVVLGILVKYPELNDAEIAKKSGITRQTVSKIKSRLIKKGVIKLINEPNFKKISCELFVAVHTKFNPQIEPNKRKLLLEKPKSKCPTIIDVESNAEEVCGSFFEDYLSFKMTQDDLGKVYRQKDLLLRESVTQIIPMQQIKFYRTDFVPIIEKTLNIKIP